MTYRNASLLPLLWLTPALLLASACETQYPSCKETMTVLDSLDAATPAGSTAAEIFALVEGQRQLELTYAKAGGDSVFVDIEPGGEGSTALTLELSRKSSGALRFIDAEVVEPTGPGPVAEIAVDCPDRIEIDATLGFVTADGVFAELLDVIVATEIDEFSGPNGELGVARIRQAFDPAALMGTLQIVSVDPPNPDFVDYEIEVEYPLSEAFAGENGEVGQPRGSVGGGAQYSSGKGRDSSVSYGIFYIATFGDGAIGDGE